MQRVAGYIRSATFLTGGASRSALAVAALAALVPGIAQAQDSESRNRDREIIVTGALLDDYAAGDQDSANRLDLSLRETPQSVSVVTRAQIEDFNLDTVDQLLTRTTGVNVDRAETDRTYYNARGFDIVNFQFDGIGQPLSYGLQNGQIDTALFERVEVVRGATGLLSMTGNPSAAVNFVRKRPLRELTGYGSVSYGSWDLFRGDFDVSVPVTRNGGIRARTVVAYEGGDSYLDYYETSKWTLYGVVAADLGSNTVVTAGYSWQESDPKGVTWGALPLANADGSQAEYDRSASSAQPWTRWNSIDRNLFGDITHDFGNGWNAKVSVLRRVRDQDARLFYIYRGAEDPTTGATLYSYPGAYLDKLRETTVDAHITGKIDAFGQSHDIVLGVNYGESSLQESEAVDYSVVGLPLPGNSAFEGSFPLPDFGAYSLQADYKTEVRSAYGLVRLSLANPFKLMLGGNVTNAKRSGISYAVPFTFDETKFLPFAGATLDLTGHLTAYASYATIYNPQTETAADGSILPPIEGTTYEAGLKGEWNQGRLTAGVSVFKTQQDNVAESLGFDATLGRTIYQAVNAESQGVEVDIAGEALPGLQLSGGYAYVDVEDDNGDDARTFIPRHTVRLSAVYSPPQFSALRVGASARYQSRIYKLNTAPVIEQGDYVIVDLMARYNLTDNVSLTANLTNVTDVKYLTSLQWDQSYYGEPRAVRFTLGVGF